MKVLIIANGDIGDIQKVKGILPAADYIICADGGLTMQRLELVPDIIIGILIPWTMVFWSSTGRRNSN